MLKTIAARAVTMVGARRAKQHLIWAGAFTVAISAALSSPIVEAQSAPLSSSGGSSVSAPAAVGNQPRLHGGVLAASTNFQPSADISALAADIREIKVELKNRPNPWFTQIVSGLLGGLIVALVALIREWQEAKRAKGVLALSATDKIMAWRLKQIEELYGPLNALLRQSRGVYTQLCNYLYEHENPNKQLYRWVKDADDSRGQSFEIYSDGWRQFRLLDQLPVIYDEAKNTGPLIDEVMAVGKRIVATIRIGAGLVLPDQSNLQEVFGEYLSHYVVLNELYKEVKKPGAKRDQLRARYTRGYFPRELDGLVRNGLLQISESLKIWESELTRLSKQKA